MDVAPLGPRGPDPSEVEFVNTDKTKLYTDK